MGRCGVGGGAGMPGPPHPDTVHRPAAAAATGPQPLGACEQQGDWQTRPMRLSGFTSRALLSLPPAFVSCLWLPSQCRPGCNIDYLSSQIWKLGTPHRRRGQTAQKPPSGPPRWKRHTHAPSHVLREKSTWASPHRTRSPSVPSAVREAGHRREQRR